MKIKKLGDISEKVILKSLSKAGDNYIATYRLSKSWTNIVGPNIAKMVKVKEMTSDGSLILKLINVSYGPEINSYKELIVSRIKMHFSDEYISEIVIIT